MTFPLQSVLYNADWQRRGRLSTRRPRAGGACLVTTDGVIYRQLPELAGQACYRVEETTGHHCLCAVRVYLRLGRSGPRCASYFPMAGESPWRSLAADICVKTL